MHVLDNVYVWNFFRKLLDLCFGSYRGVDAIVREFDIDRSVSMLDVGCGTGQHSALTDGEYLGIDMDCRYIEYASKHYGTEKKKFQCVKLQDADLQGRTFEIALLVDLLHHISDPDARDLLASLAKRTSGYLVAFDPIEQSPDNYIGRFLTSHDRGKFIRPLNKHLGLIREYFDILKVKQGKKFSTEAVAVLARLKRQEPTKNSGDL
jgi:2-polyprenyl-3-methyl-5-hydroxy-6-metoxy-1,4-benzoquinol methylase